jgi:predicted DNA-binding WGR domain protein
MPPFNTLSYLERHQPEKNMHRYYRLYVLPTFLVNSLWYVNRGVLADQAR